MTLAEYCAQRWPDNTMVSECLQRAYVKYKGLGLSDSHLESELTSNDTGKFWQRLWEINLGLYLNDNGLKISSRNDGPDFLVSTGDVRVWIEAVCPEPSEAVSGYLQLPKSIEDIEAKSVPHEEILLRWTSALFDKKRKFSQYLRQRLIGEEDCQVVAVNGCQLSHGALAYDTGISGLPYILEAVAPFGPRFVTIDRTTMKSLGAGISYRAELKKSSGSPVSTNTFFDPEYAHISAVFASNANLNQTCGDKFHTLLVHNPNAVVPLPAGAIPATEIYRVAEEGDRIILKREVD